MMCVLNPHGMARFTVMLSIFVLCTAQAPTPNFGQRLTGEEIRAAFVGNTLIGVAQGVTTYAYFDPNGTKAFRSVRMNDSGTWRITRDGTMCGAWVFIRQGADTCAIVYRDGDKFTSVTNGAPFPFTIKPGKPE